MAKIALTVIGGVAGGLIGLLTGGIGVGMGIELGASLGAAVGGVLFRPQVPGMMPLQDRQVSSAADGAPISFGYGVGRVAGQVIWSPGIQYYSVGSSSGGSGKGGGSSVGLQFVYQASFAAAFGEGPAVIQAIWADSKLIYQGGQNFGTYAPWDATLLYVPETLVSYQFQPAPDEDFITGIFQCSIGNENVPPAGASLYWSLTGINYYDSTVQYYPGNQVAYPPNQGQLYAPTSGQIFTCVSPCLGVTPAPASDWNTVQEYYGEPALYTGDGLQMPDPTIQANNGVDATPAFRGITYAVWEKFPLANFGNRVPNLRAQVAYSLPSPPPAELTFTVGVDPSALPYAATIVTDAGTTTPVLPDVSNLVPFIGRTQLDVEMQSPITSLDVSRLATLVNLNVGADTSLASLNVSGLTALQFLVADGHNLTALDLSGLTALIEADAFTGPLITVNATGCGALNTLELQGNALTAITLAGCAALQTLELYSNNFTSIDLGGLAALLTVDLSYNALDQASVDGVLADLAANGLSDGYLDLSAGTNATPSIVGAASAATLTSRGWYVATN